MRTTIDLPAELHQRAQATARDTRRTSSETVAEHMHVHVHHDAAAAWLSTDDPGFATCPLTQGSLVRFLVRSGHSASAARDVAAFGNASRHESLATLDHGLAHVHGDVAGLVPTGGAA